MINKLLTVLIFLMLTGQSWGATYNIGPGQTYPTFAALHAAVAVQIGDIVDGGGNTFFERVVPNGPATYQNFTLDGRVSLDGSWSYRPGNTYSKISAWTLVNGTTEVFKKASTRVTFIVFEDDVIMTARVTTSEADVVANLARGEYSFNNNVLYYRASDGAAAATHTITGTGRGFYDNNDGILYAKGIHGLKISNVTVKNYAANTSVNTSVVFVSCSNLTLTGITITQTWHGLRLTSCANVTLDSTSSITHNFQGGVLIEGNSSNITISGNISYNGREKRYDGGTYAYTQDGDGVGIGGIGGTLTNILITNATISYNGAPNGDQTPGNNNDFGAGVYVGTSPYAMDAGVSVTRCNIFENHSHGIYFGDEFTGGTIAYNIVRSNANGAINESPHAVSINATNARFTSLTVANNVIYKNNGVSGLYINATGTGKTVSVKNNIFYNNGRAVDFRGDLWLVGSELSNVTESNNIFYRNGTAWDSAKVIEHVGTSSVSWNGSHIVGKSAGYWQYDRGKGSGDIVGDPLFVSASDLRLQTGSPAIQAGVYIPGVHDAEGAKDIAGESLINMLVPDIGAYRYKGAVTRVPNTPQNLRVIRK